MLFTSEGKGIRFKETDVRAMGRTARGVRGIKVPDGHKVISLIIEKAGEELLTASSKGYGKRTRIDDFNLQGRGGQGVIAMITNSRNGDMVGVIPVADNDEVMLISDQGTLVRTRVDGVSVLGRNTQGVTLIKVSEGEQLVGVERIDSLGVQPDEAAQSDEAVQPDEPGSANNEPNNEESGASSDDSNSGSEEEGV